jgi:DNA-binding NtrC family response regulator
MLPNTFIEPDPQRHQVLLVEDEPVVRALLAEELRSTGFMVIEAANADEAWDFLQAGGKADLVFSDVTMPGSMNGVELIRRVKRTYPHIEAIITSGNPGPASIADICTFLQKPYRLAEAARTVMRCLAERSVNE